MRIKNGSIIFKETDDGMRVSYKPFPNHENPHCIYDNDDLVRVNLDAADRVATYSRPSYEGLYSAFARTWDKVDNYEPTFRTNYISSANHNRDWYI